MRKNSVPSGCVIYGLGRCLGDCKPVLPEGQKYQFVTTQTVEAISLNKLMADLGFLCLKYIFAMGWLEFVTQAFGGFPKLFSSELAISMTNKVVQNLYIHTKNFLLS